VLYFNNTEGRWLLSYDYAVKPNQFPEVNARCIVKIDVSCTEGHVSQSLKDCVTKAFLQQYNPVNKCSLRLCHRESLRFHFPLPLYEWIRLNYDEALVWWGQQHYRCSFPIWTTPNNPNSLLLTKVTTTNIPTNKVTTRLKRSITQSNGGDGEK
jgi:hypothetical protein